jgi:IclR family pca regulon transcriptional regulator
MALNESISRPGRGNADESVEPDKEFMTTLAKGLSVLGAFGPHRPSMTLSEAAAISGLSRATARRILRTLSALGYVIQDDRRFFLAPRILELGFGFLSTQSWIDRAEPLMKELSSAVKESCSAAVLQ